MSIGVRKTPLGGPFSFETDALAKAPSAGAQVGRKRLRYQATRGLQNDPRGVNVKERPDATPAHLS